MNGKKITMTTKPSRVEKIADSLKHETTRFTIDIDTELHRRFKSYCAAKGLKMADIIRELVEKTLDHGES